MVNKRNSYAFWLGFLTAIVIVAGFSIYFYQDNKDKKLKEIKSDLEIFFKKKFERPSKISKKITIKKVIKPRIPPKKFISKR